MTLASTLQKHIIAARIDIGAADGIAGPRTYAGLLAFTVNSKITPLIADLGSAFAKHLPTYEINTPLRLCHLVGQAAVESDRFRTLQEYGGASYFARYDGRRDLGNLQPDDGARFHGRGLLQITGRHNYDRYGAKLGLDLTNHPEMAASADTGTRICLVYWSDHDINDDADRDDTKAVTKQINGGLNGYSERLAYTMRAKRLFV